ncbi:hypothetical protein Cus16_1266 [Curtobacterium sp. ER1/6]|nr:hypothetical protein Cus16_1266 [Curtobacterium sp. ER1/6]
MTLSTDATVTTAVTRRTPPSEGARTPRWWHRGRVGSGTGRRDTPEMHASGAFDLHTSQGIRMLVHR